jgi:DNA-binding GntR family transcriptional regulator
MLRRREIAPGSRIGVEALARTLGVSQTPVREALSRLEAEQLVTRITNIGFCAAPALTPQEIAELFEVRLLLDPFVARRAAVNITSTEMAELQQVVAEVAALPNGGRGLRYGDFLALDMAFNRIVAGASGNSIITGMLERIHTHAHLLAEIFEAELSPQALDEMNAIFAAIANRDEDAAEQTMRRHIARSAERFSEYLCGRDETCTRLGQLGEK